MTTKQQYIIRASQVLTVLVAVWLGLQLIRGSQQSTGSSAAQPNTLGQSVVSDTTQAVCTATVNTRLLNQRSGPGTGYSIVGNAGNGEVFTVQAWNTDQQWVAVTTADGSAWLYVRYVTLKGDCSRLPTSSMATNTAAPETAATNVPARATPQPTAQPTTASTTSTAVGALSTIFTPQVQYWAAEIEAWAAAYQLDPNLIATVMQIESCGDPTIHSTAGAQGLFQVMPFHFTAGEDMLDVETNARRGLTYLKGALELAQGNAGSALVGYNGGYGAMSGNWAAETQRYYYWGSGIYGEATSGVAVSTTLQTWLAAGGTNLCTRTQASQQLLA